MIEQIKPVYFNLVVKIFQDINKGVQLCISKQNEANATYSLWLDDQDYYIDWNWNAEKIKRFIDAVGYPYDNAKAYLNGEIVKFVDVEIVKDVVIEHRDRHIGKVIFVKGGMPTIVCTDGLLGLIDIRDEKGNVMFINFRSRFESKR